MKFVTVAEIRQQLSKYIKQIEDTGEEVIITKNGHPAIIMRTITEEDFTLIDKDKTSQKMKRG